MYFKLIKHMVGCIYKCSLLICYTMVNIFLQLWLESDVLWSKCLQLNNYMIDLSKCEVTSLFLCHLISQLHWTQISNLFPSWNTFSSHHPGCFPSSLFLCCLLLALPPLVHFWNFQVPRLYPGPPSCVSTQSPWRTSKSLKACPWLSNLHLLLLRLLGHHIYI